MTRTTAPPPAIIPPYMLEALAQSDDPLAARHARESLEHDAELRPSRRTPTARPTRTRAPRREDLGDGAPGAHGTGPHRTVADARGTQNLPGTTVRTEGGPPTSDVAALVAGVRPRLPRRQGHAPARHGPLRPQLRQRLLGRLADGLR